MMPKLGDLNYMMSTVTVELSDEIIQELSLLDREDLPERLAITLSIRMYPWLGELLQILKTECENRT